MNVKLTAAQKIQVANSRDMYKIMQDILLRESRLRRAQEHFWIIGLNNANRILFIELLALGAHNRMIINAPEVFRMAIYKLATRAVLVHNHPSGNIHPSTEDQAFTDKMLKAGQFLNIEVIDHLVISETDYTSFESAGLMEKLRNSGHWELIDRSKGELRDLRAEIEKDKASNERAISIAQKLKASGMPNETIKKMTGLNLNEIKRL